MDMNMIWPSAQSLVDLVPPPEGYHYELLRSADVPELVRKVDEWFPGLSVSNASCFLREDFYANRVVLDQDSDRDFFVLMFKKGDEWAGMLSVERDRDSKVIYGRVGTIAESHRGARLSKCFPALMEAMGTFMGMGMVYSLATLKVAHMQTGFEKAGWQLIGIIPGFDRELVGPGSVKRVFEAIYVKVLVTSSEFVLPTATGMTPMTKALFDLLYPGQLGEAAAG
jgi:hypothetical protein